MTQFHNLDLEYIKNDIKEFIKKNSTILEDYNYEGSAISNMINVLAYVTQYNMFYLNSITNELFMSSAQLNNSVHRLANMLNYIPKRNVAPSCDVVLTNNSSDSQYLYYGSEFVSDSIDMTYIGDVITIPSGASVTVSLYQGTLVTQNWISDGTPFQSYMLTDKETVDNRFISVGVGNSTSVSYDWININTQNPIVGGKYYYIDYLDAMYVKFDNGVLYQIPVANETVSVRYLKTEGDSFGNTVMVDADVSSENGNITGKCITNFTNGENAETLEEIKSRAILNYTTQNRAVTQSDYNIFFEKYPGYSDFQDSFIFGGENVFIDVNGNQIEYVAGGSWQDVGYVYLAALRKSNDIYDFGYLTDADKETIENYFLPYKVITIFLKFVDPVIVYFNPQFRIKAKSMVDFDTTGFKKIVDDHLTDTYTGMNLTLSKSNIIKFIDSIQTVNYSDMEYDVFAKVSKNSSTYTIVPLGTELQTISGYFCDIGTISEKIEVGFTIKNGVNEAKVIDTNGHEYNGSAKLSLAPVGSSTFAVGQTVQLLDREGTLIASPVISAYNKMYITTMSEASTLYVYNSSATVSIGTVNTETGFIKINNYVSTLLDEMDTFGFNFELADDISYSASREVFVCPELSTIEYL